MRQQKKIFTRLLMNNWGGVSHKVLEFHEYVNLFSGKSGSGKSTVMDAIQVVLYGSVSSSFLNKAADDTKNRRTVLSYLRGAQKDGSYNRDGQDFCSQIVLEVKDTASRVTTCVGVHFEVGKQDTTLNKYQFFSHSGKMPEDFYLTPEGTPYLRGDLKKLIEQRKQSEDNRGVADVNRFYPSKEAYLNTLYEVIFGGIDPSRFATMEKSAIALRMTSGTGQFIKDYMFPKSTEDTVSTISEQLGAYREIKERVDDLEKRIGLLTEVREHHLALIAAQADKVHAERMLKVLDIETTRAKLETRQEDLKGILARIEVLAGEKSALEAEQKSVTDELIEVSAKLQASDYGVKKRELEETMRIAGLVAANSERFRKLIAGLGAWEDDEDISGYVSNPTLQAMEDLVSGNVTGDTVDKVRKGIASALSVIDEEMTELSAGIRDMTKELREKKEEVSDLKQDRKPYRKELKSARAQLQSELSAMYGRTIHVEIFADLFDITDEKWKDAVEGRLGRIKHSLITEPAFALDAAKIFRRMKRKEYEEVELINTAAIERDQRTAEAGTLYEAVSAKPAYVDLCLKRYLGRIVKCETVEELHEVRDGVTPDCYSYSNYIFRHLRAADYTKFACIGTKVSKARLKELESEVYDLEQQLLGDMQMRDTLSRARDFERLSESTEEILELAKAPSELEKVLKRQDKLREELMELADGTLAAELKKRQQELDEQKEAIDEKIERISDERIGRERDRGFATKDIAALEEKLSILTDGFIENTELSAEVAEALSAQSEVTLRRKLNEKITHLSEEETACGDARTMARNAFNREYPAYGFTGIERGNEDYDDLLQKLSRDFEPKYKEEFEKQYQLVYHSLRENVIATIHGEIKAAYRHRREINRLLQKIRFSDSTYQIDILPAQNENGQFYEMLMAEELDSKVLDNAGFEGQMSLGEDDFYRKYEQEILRLTEKFMPLRGEDGQKQTLHKQEMERYADYRSYLTFSMYERVVDENGNVKKNYVDEMAGRDSGGEGQNPKYVALLAGFAMLYMQLSSRDSKIRLVLLDEAFSKMDKERSEVCLHYARELELQLIVCVPDERLQSLIRNVDSVYGFRRFQNRISMMHIDKGEYLELVEGKDKDESDG